MAKLEQEPRLPNESSALVEWARRVASAFNPLIDAIGPIRIPATSISETLDGPAFHAYFAANALVANGSFFKVAPMSVQFDTASGFSAVGGRFTAPVAGYYQVSAAVYLLSSGGPMTYAECEIRKNGSSARHIALDTSGTSQSFWARSGGGLVQMAVGDYLELWALAVVSAGTVSAAGDAGGVQTYLSAHLARRA